MLARREQPLQALEVFPRARRVAPFLKEDHALGPQGQGQVGSTGQGPVEGVQGGVGVTGLGQDHSHVGIGNGMAGVLAQDGAEGVDGALEILPLEGFLSPAQGRRGAFPKLPGGRCRRGRFRSGSRR